MGQWSYWHLLFQESSITNATLIHTFSFSTEYYKGNTCVSSLVYTATLTHPLSLFLSLSLSLSHSLSLSLSLSRCDSGAVFHLRNIGSLNWNEGKTLGHVIHARVIFIMLSEDTPWMPMVQMAPRPQKQKLPRGDSVKSIQGCQFQVMARQSNTVSFHPMAVSDTAERNNKISLC